jgi:hypothetical protein
VRDRFRRRRSCYERHVDVIRWVHIAAGSVALGAFWIPIVARKGGPAHRRSGWVYACGMGATALAAWTLCADRLLDTQRQNDGPAWFLAFVGLLSANGAATGIRVLRRKFAEKASPWDVGSSAVLLIAALALGGRGLREHSTLELVFSALGIALAVRQLRYWLQGPRTKAAWWTTHLGNMLVACIGTVTAFLVVNVPRFGLERYSLVFWIGPGVLGGAAIAFWTRYYRRKFETPTPRGQ